MWQPNENSISPTRSGRFFARQYGMPPATGRVAGWLLLCDPPAQTAAEIAEELQMSRSAVGAVVSHWLETVRDGAQDPRLGRTGRPDRRSTPPTAMQSLESAGEYEALAALSRSGLAAIADASLERRAPAARDDRTSPSSWSSACRSSPTNGASTVKTLRATGELP